MNLYGIQWVPDHSVADTAHGASDEGMPERRRLRLRLLVEAIGRLVGHFTT
jgi:hypothetical protein